MVQSKHCCAAPIGNIQQKGPVSHGGVLWLQQVEISGEMDPAVRGLGRQFQVGDDLVAVKFRVQGKVGSANQEFVRAGITKTATPFKRL